MTARALPLALTALRLLLAPTVVALALAAPSRAGFGACLVAAFVSDVFDGILARRLGVATPALRRFDSLADSAFYLATTFAVWHLAPAAIRHRAVPLLVLVGLEAARYGVDFVRFRREAAYHMWSSKAWGIALFAGFFELLALGRDGLALDAAVYLGILSDLEGLAISAVLPGWRTDVPSLAHALRMRRSA